MTGWRTSSPSSTKRTLIFLAMTSSQHWVLCWFFYSALKRNPVGVVNTTCRWATGEQTSSTMRCALSSVHFWWHKGHIQRCLPKWATFRSPERLLSGQVAPGVKKPETESMSVSTSPTARYWLTYHITQLTNWTEFCGICVRILAILLHFVLPRTPTSSYRAGNTG